MSASAPVGVIVCSPLFRLLAEIVGATYPFAFVVFSPFINPVIWILANDKSGSSPYVIVSPKYFIVNGAAVMLAVVVAVPFAV